jgi:CBS domain-containing protein
MPHPVRDWMSSPVVVVDPDTSVSHAATMMRRRNIHSVVVDTGDKNAAYGIVTTTDIRDKIVGEAAIPPIPPCARSCLAPSSQAKPTGR